MFRSETKILDTAVRPVSNPAPGGLLFAVLGSAVLFNFALCFINTQLFSVARVHVELFEVAIVAVSLFLALPAIRLTEYLLLLGIVLWALVAAFLRADFTSGTHFNVQPARDFLIPVVFFLLGTRCAEAAVADRILSAITAIVLTVAIIELFFLAEYVKYFDIISYYFARGSISAEQLALSSAKLFVSGVRPEGRMLFPFIGDHRVSSVFLEPVSPGNFAVLLFYWALVRSFVERRLKYVQFAGSLLLTVLADSRFGLIMCGGGLFFYLIMYRLPWALVRRVLQCLPYAATVAVIAIALANPLHPIDDSLIGRSVSSGQTLMSLSFYNWLGLEGVSRNVNIYDSGYTYTFVVIGAPAFLVLWALLVSLEGKAREFQAFQAMLALYYALLLCVSYSPFTIKTAAVAWFLLGALRGDWVPVVDASADSVPPPRDRRLTLVV